MNSSEVRAFEQIKDKIEVLKSKKAKAEGAVETIEKEWESNYGFSTLEKAEEYLEGKKKEQAENDEQLDSLFKELNGLTNWALI